MRVLTAFALGLLASSTASADMPGFLRFLFPRHELSVITVTDASPEGRTLPRATPGQPQYYVAVSLGFRDIGGAMGGIKEPRKEYAHKLLAAELAKQGYLPAKVGGPPATLLLVFAWGTLNADTIRPNVDFPPVQLNRGQILRYLGGAKVGFNLDHLDSFMPEAPGLTLYSYDKRVLWDMSSEDFYIMTVGAYDLASAMKKEIKKPLWVTRIAAPSLGFELGEIMPAMLAIAGPQFGRDTPKPVWVNASDKFVPNVKLGELQLVEYLQNKPVPNPVSAEDSKAH